MTLNNPTGRTSPHITKEEALFNFYSAERRAGTPALEANERMHFFAKRLDAQLEREMAPIKSCLERTR